MNENGLLFKGLGGGGKGDVRVYSRRTLGYTGGAIGVLRKDCGGGGGEGKGRRDWQKQESRSCEVIKNNGYYAFHRSRASKYIVCVHPIAGGSEPTAVSME